MSSKIAYLIGSMEGRQYKDVKFEHYYIRRHLEELGVEVIDPLLKEKHNQDEVISLHKAGMEPLDICEMDLQSVERAHILFWCTADKITEGSETEFAGGGWYNRFLRKGIIKKNENIPKKLLIMVGEQRQRGQINHFQNMWDGVHIFKDVDGAILFIKRWLKRGNK